MLKRLPIVLLFLAAALFLLPTSADAKQRAPKITKAYSFGPSTMKKGKMLLSVKIKRAQKVFIKVGNRKNLRKAKRDSCYSANTGCTAPPRIFKNYWQLHLPTFKKKKRCYRIKITAFNKNGSDKAKRTVCYTYTRSGA